GKIDRSKLPEPEKLEGVSGSMAAPENDIEQKLVNAWQEVLGLTAVGVEDNFFDIGGHSLKAITLVARLKQEFIVDVADIFAYPTIRQLARHIEYRPNHLREKLTRIRERYAAALDGEAPAMAEARYRYRSGIEDRMQPEAQRRTEYRHVLLTGATGYLGAYLLNEIILRTGSEVSVIVRGRTPDEARGRLADKLAYYFGPEWFPMHAARIHLVNGELSAERLGLEVENYERLAGEVDCIVHAAANVKHYGQYDEFVRSNVTATERLIELALERTPKAFHHVSTMSVGMGTIEGRAEVLFTEDDGDLGQQHLNVYVKTKFEAELRIQEARARGLQASIYRVGNIVCHSDTGHFQENIADNAFYNTIKAYLGLGVVLASEPDTDLSFVNQVSAAIVTLFDKPALYNGTYHVYNPHLIRLSELLAVHTGIAVKPLAPGPFFDELYARFEREENREAVESVLLHNGWMDEASGETVFVHTGERTAALLARLGFAWTKPAEAEFRRLLQHAETLNKSTD
ncbi:thioester reductase domain-containing protein, partial [Paenibacillus popilliae]